MLVILSIAITSQGRLRASNAALRCMRFHPASQVFDVETGDYTTLHDANPQGWEQVEVDEAGAAVMLRVSWLVVGGGCGSSTPCPTA